MKQNTLSLCMIVKDEEQNLANCLNSIKDYVDEIIIVDTGSVDNTINIAKSFGAIVIEEPWQNNFSLARNAGLEKATADWILFLDADEEVLPGSLQDIKNLDYNNFEGYFLQIINFDNDGNYLKQSSLRLFKNNPLHRFNGAIHEQIIDSILKLKPKARFGSLDITIKHTGYQDQSISGKDKIKRNLSILQSEFDKGNRDSFLLFNLGTEHLRSGNFTTALKYYNMAEPAAEPWLSFTHLLGKKKAQCQLFLDDYEGAMITLDKYLALYPDYTDLVYIKATLLYRQAKFYDALELYRKCLSMGDPPACYVSENGVGSFKAETAIKHVITLLEQHEINSNKKPGLSLCMIVRNEEKNLPRCINSVKNLVDEIIMVDTGSDDRTMEVGKSLGAKVFSFPWTDDFARARNFSLELATKAWILVLDADETLRPHEHHLIKELISDSNHCEGYYLKVVNYFNSDPDDYIIDAVCRLFRNKPEYRFAGAVHETVTPAIIKNKGRSCIIPAEIHIDHRGYLNKPILSQKNLRNVSILDLQVEKAKADSYTFYALGTEQFQQSNFNQALKYYQQSLEITDGSDIISDVYFKMAVCYLELGQYQQGLNIIKQGQKIFPDFTSLWYLQGMLEFRQGHYEKARLSWQHTLDMGDPPWYHYTFPHGIGSFRTAAALAQCLEKMGLDDQAEALLATHIMKKQGLRTLLLPYYNLLVKKYEPAKCLELIELKVHASDFKSSLLLAETFNKLNRPDFTQKYIKRCFEYIKGLPTENDYLQLAGMQLGLAIKYCDRAADHSVQSPILKTTQEKLISILDG